MVYALKDVPYEWLEIVKPKQFPTAREDAPRLECASQRSRKGVSLRARMNPISWWPPTRPTRFLPTREDALGSHIAASLLGAVPPRARGCTAPPAALDALGCGFPARARMHPPVLWRGLGCTRFPRAREDAPMRGPYLIKRVPPRAGMHRPVRRSARRRRMFPRVRGDASSSRRRAVPGRLVPPRACGDTTPNLFRVQGCTLARASVISCVQFLARGCPGLGSSVVASGGDAPPPARPQRPN